MIKNEQQARITERKLAAHRERLARLRSKYLRDADFEFFSAATREQIEQMEQELAYYSLAKQGNVGRLIELWNERGSVQPGGKGSLRLGDLIALLRVARGLTQEQLAQQLGLDQAHVARYERGDYAGYSVDVLDRIFRALGAKLTLGPLDLPRAA
jgi:hypothetical protein